MLDDKNVDIFIKNNVLTAEEIKARYNTYIERYNTLINIELNTAIQMLKTKIIPTISNYQGKLVSTINDAASSGVFKIQETFKPQIEIINTLAQNLNSISSKVKILEEEIEKLESLDTEQLIANTFANKLLPMLSDIRDIVDASENIVDDKEWPLPKYREMLFVY